MSWNFRLSSMLLVWHTCRQGSTKMLSRDEAGRHHLLILHLPHFSSPVSPGQKSVLLSCNLTFMTDMQGTLLRHLDLVVRGTCAYSHTGLHMQHFSNFDLSPADTVQMQSVSHKVWGGAWDPSLTRSQVMRMLLVHGPHLLTSLSQF